MIYKEKTYTMYRVLESFSVKKCEMFLCETKGKKEYVIYIGIYPHHFSEDNCFKTEKEAILACSNLIDKKILKLKSDIDKLGEKRIQLLKRIKL